MNLFVKYIQKIQNIVTHSKTRAKTCFLCFFNRQNIWPRAKTPRLQFSKGSDAKSRNPYIQVAHPWRTPKKRGAKCLYISGAPPGAPFQFILCSSLQWRRTAPELPGQASLSDSMTRLSDGMVVQARLHLNQGMGAFLLLLEINILLSHVY